MGWSSRERRPNTYHNRAQHCQVIIQTTALCQIASLEGDLGAHTTRRGVHMSVKFTPPSSKQAQLRAYLQAATSHAEGHGIHVNKAIRVIGCWAAGLGIITASSAGASSCSCATTSACGHSRGCSIPSSGIGRRGCCACSCTCGGGGSSISGRLDDCVGVSEDGHPNAHVRSSALANVGNQCPAYTKKQQQQQYHVVHVRVHSTCNC